MSMTAIGYIRRSKESGARTVSLEEQASKIQEYCAERGWTLVDVLADDGVSGGRRDRLTRLEKIVRTTKVGAVVVYHLDRLGRDVSGVLDGIRAFGKRGVELHVVEKNGPVEVNTANGFLMTGIESVMHEHYRRVISEKTRDALQRLKLKGRRVSRIIPYGYRLSADGIHLEAEPKEQENLAVILELSKKAKSLRKLSAELASRGILARTGRPFHPQSLSKIVCNRPLADNRAA